MTFAATVLTLYPEMFPGPLGVSLAGRAMAEGTWALDTVQIRDFAYDKHRTVDDTPAGGGAGMVLRVDVLAKAIDHARAFLPGTGRGTTEGGGGAGAANPTSEGRESPHVPLHHPADGPPPPVGEEPCSAAKSPLGARPTKASPKLARKIPWRLPAPFRSSSPMPRAAT